jgi:hypothetical protein
VSEPSQDFPALVVHDEEFPEAILPNRSAGTRFAEIQRSTSMKKNTQILKPRKLSLGDLIMAVSSCTKNTKETVAAVADLLGSGQVRVENNGRFTRARVC